MAIYLPGPQVTGEYDPFFHKRPNYKDPMTKWRGAGYGGGWLGMKGSGATNGKCRVVRPADKAAMTIKDVQIKLNELSAKYDKGNPEHRRQWAQLNARIRQLRAD